MKNKILLIKSLLFLNIIKNANLKGLLQYLNNSKIYNNEMKFFFKNIFKQDKNKAYRRDDNYYDYKC